MPTIFDPIKIGSATAPNRIAMAPMTRARATKEGVPTPVMADYYQQRGDAGIVITEATGISREGLGWGYAPGIWNPEQTEAWKPITAAAHSKGGLIYCQLWHMGRVAAPDVIDSQVIGASDLRFDGEVHGYNGRMPPGQPKAATLEDIKRIQNDYVQASKNAIEAGFDGIQLHAANGYLIEQFLKKSANNRTDQYGGSLENQRRFLIETLEAVIAAIGADKVAVRLSPNSQIQGCLPDEDNLGLYLPVVKKMSDLGIAFLELREPRAKDDPTPLPRFDTSDSPRLLSEIRKVFKGPLITNQEFTAEEAKGVIEKGEADMIAFGRPFIYNPDLVTRIRKGIRWAQGKGAEGWYTQTGAKFYTDYPAANL